MSAQSSVAADTPAETEPTTRSDQVVKPPAQAEEDRIEAANKYKNNYVLLASKRRRASKRRTRRKAPYGSAEDMMRIMKEYKSATGSKQRDRIYTKHIHPIFHKMATWHVQQSFRAGRTIGVESDVLINEGIKHAWLALDKFDLDKATNVFSYFNLIIKREITNVSHRAYRYSTKNEYIEDDQNEYNTTIDSLSVSNRIGVVEAINTNNKTYMLEHVLDSTNSIPDDITVEDIADALDDIEDPGTIDSVLVAELFSQDPELVAMILNFDSELFTEKGMRNFARRHLVKNIKNCKSRVANLKAAALQIRKDNELANETNK